MMDKNSSILTELDSINWNIKKQTDFALPCVQSCYGTKIRTSSFAMMTIPRRL